MADELQRERDAAEAERRRLLAEQQAALDAEAQHKAELLQKLEAHSQEAQSQAAAHEAERQQLLATVAQQKQQLDDAAAAAAVAEERHAKELEEARAAAAAEVASAAAAGEEQRSTAEAAHVAELAGLKEELARTQQLLVGSREESRILQEHQEQQLKELEVRVAVAVW